MKKLKSISGYFFFFFNIFLVKLKTSYFKTVFYNTKISKNLPSRFNYKPSLHIINSLMSFDKKRIKIHNLSLNSIWKVDDKNSLEFQNLHNFLWLTVLDIKTNKASTQTIIENWIDNNNDFNEETWKLDILSKRLIAWISNSNLTLDESRLKYKEKFILSITKQTNHLSINIDSLEDDENKLTCCSSLILVGLAFKNQYKHYKSGLLILKKFVKNNFDNSGFPKSRNPEELMACLKYLILIKEWIKESQNQIPDYLEEIIFNCGKSYSFLSKNLSELPLFNGSSKIKNDEFEKYLNYLNYNFNDNSKEKSGYIIFKNKKIVLIMDIGSSPDFKYSKKYQSGCLSFEITSNEEKLICNSGFDINKSIVYDFESEETTHFSIVDHYGNAVSLTTTINGLFGNGIVVDGAGFLLNNEMGDFNAGPGRTNDQGLIGTEPNLTRPEQRMLSSMSPSIVAKDGELVAVVGSPGGRTIINTVLQVILNVIEFDMNIQEALDAAAVYSLHFPSSFYPRPAHPGVVVAESRVPREVIEELERRGHRVEVADAWSAGKVMGIRYDEAHGVIMGGASPKGDIGYALGW